MLVQLKNIGRRGESRETVPLTCERYLECQSRNQKIINKQKAFSKKGFLVLLEENQNKRLGGIPGKPEQKIRWNSRKTRTKD